MRSRVKRSAPHSVSRMRYAKVVCVRLDPETDATLHAIAKLRSKRYAELLREACEDFMRRWIEEQRHVKAFREKRRVG